MDKGEKLSDIEKGQIQAFKVAGYTNRWIARRIGRSHHVVGNFLANIEGDETKKNTGRPKKLSSRTQRRVLTELTNYQKGVRRVRDEVAPDVSYCTVWRVAKNSPNIALQRLKACPQLTNEHKLARIRFAEEHITWTHQWQTVI